MQEDKITVSSETKSKEIFPNPQQLTEQSLNEQMEHDEKVKEQLEAEQKAKIEEENRLNIEQQEKIKAEAYEEARLKLESDAKIQSDLINNGITLEPLQTIIKNKISNEPRPVTNTGMPVVRNDGFQKITIRTADKSWTIHKGAQILISNVPMWVKQHPEFQAFRREKTLTFTTLSINR